MKKIISIKRWGEEVNLDKFTPIYVSKKEVWGHYEGLGGIFVYANYDCYEIELED